MLDAHGEPTPLFTKYASAVLDALDAAVNPKGTGWFEYTKLVHLEKIGSIAGSSSLETFEQEELLRMFQSFNCEARMVPAAIGGESSEQVALTRDGAMVWLRFAMLHDPNEQLLFWGRMLRALKVNLPPVKRSMLPAAPNKEVVALVEAFEAECAVMAAAERAEMAKTVDNMAKAMELSVRMNARANQMMVDSVCPSSTRVEYRYW